MTAGDESDGRGRALLALARAALAEELAGERPAEPPPAEWLERPGACFVTLEVDGELRGCIGSIDAYRPLAEDVRANALAAALRDPRFRSLGSAELASLRISVSLLSPLEPLSFAGEADLVRQLRPGRDGLVLEHGDRRGTFLPAVWRHFPEPAEFVTQLKRKAGLAADFWAPDVAVWRYTTESWSEEGFRAG